MTSRWIRALGVLCAASVAAGWTAAPANARPQDGRGPARHVLLLSVDGLHQSDLSWYVAHHPGSALAALTRGGEQFTHARTPVPSDSFPGLLAQVTGGTPRSTGVLYDVTYNHALLPPGTTDCAHTRPGTVVAYDESVDENTDALDAGQGLAGLPESILSMTGDPTTLIDPAKLPVDPRTCRPVYPHSYLKVNTIFEVARGHGLRTAWSDKHPAYELLNGPSGKGVQDLFAPEINSVADLATGGDWTTVNSLTREYDSFKVRAVLNEIDGFDHSGQHRVGTPAIFGMNFQTVSTAQKLPVSDGLPGGYLADGKTPGPLLVGALDYIDAQVGAFTAELSAHGRASDTTIILSAKHGQSPQEPGALTRVDDGTVLDGLNAAWKAAHPGAGDLVAAGTDDDVMLLWLTDRSRPATEFARTYLLQHAATGNDITGAARTVAASGLARAFAGADAARFLGMSPKDPRHPDVLGLVQHGVVYTGGKSKISEHGGADPQDRDVPLVLAGAGIDHGRVRNEPVLTTRVAPTILRLLGLNPRELAAVRIEHTGRLPL